MCRFSDTQAAFAKSKLGRIVILIDLTKESHESVVNLVCEVACL